jgi:hypothetical protein
VQRFGDCGQRNAPGCLWAAWWEPKRSLAAVGVRAGWDMVVIG